MKIIDALLGQTDAIILAMETEDELGTILRLHLVLEKLLVFYLNQKRKDEVATFVHEPRDFGGKLSLAVAFGFPLVMARIYRQVNNIRNKLAHEATGELKSGDVQELARKVNDLNQLDPHFAKLERMYVEFVQKRPNEKLSFGSSGPRIDALIAIIATYEFSVRWLVANHYEFPQSST